MTTELSRHQRRSLEARSKGFCVQCLSRKAIPLPGSLTCERCRAANRGKYTSDVVLSVKAFVRALRAETVCAICGAQPIEWHRKEHAKRPQDRVSNKASRGESIEAIRSEIALSQPLCVSCHRAEDSRRDPATGRYLRKELGA